MTARARTADTVQKHRFPCDACGADMRFDPGGDRLICDHCGNIAEIDGMTAPASVIVEQDYAEALRHPDSLPQEVTRVLTCTNCAAQIEFQPNVHAAECPYCATPVVTDTGKHRHIKPQAIAPFVLTEDQARHAMTDWLGRLWFAPSGVEQYARKGRRMTGVYTPFWTYDAATRSRYTGERGTVYYETQRVMRDGKPTTIQVQKVRWRPASGRVARAFDDLLVLAATSLPKQFTDALAPWRLSDVIPYTPELLAGFRAEGYTVALDAGMIEARAEMDRMIARDVRFDIGGDRQRIHRIETQVSDVTFKHVLLPIWVAAYKYRGQSYRFVVNGQTGAVAGERPYSAIKIALAVVAGAILAAAVGYVAAQGG
jgi:DNA-directed RNA polymerase subunit RPC12/RpoP